MPVTKAFEGGLTRLIAEYELFIIAVHIESSTMRTITNPKPLSLHFKNLY